MSDRTRPSATSSTNAAPRMRTAGGPTSARDRSNLFRSHLTRRPTAGSSSQAETVHLDSEPQMDTSDIVVRNQHGEIDVEESPEVDLDEIEEAGVEERQETEKERQRLADAVKQHRINHTTVPDQPEELLEAVRSSLRSKVDALGDDNWMFEPEEQPRG